MYSMTALKSFAKWAFAGTYIIGYWFYVISSGIYSWNLPMPFWDWIDHMVWQITIYGLLWPIFVW